ncbi:hypothetical protein BAE44_0018927, partial [Dichanthelium oligosanthes]
MALRRRIGYDDKRNNFSHKESASHTTRTATSPGCCAGRVGRARDGWDVGVRMVTFARGLDHLGLGFLGDLEDLSRSTAIVEVHQDEVWEVPPRVTVLASSDKTRVEAFAVGSTRWASRATRSTPPTSSTPSSTGTPHRMTSRGPSATRRAGRPRRLAGRTTARSGRISARWTARSRVDQRRRRLRQLVAMVRAVADAAKVRRGGAGAI